MTHVLKAKLTAVADVVVLKLAGAVWKLVKVFDPRPVQEHFAARPPVNGVTFGKVFSLPREDAGQSIVRLGWQHIKSENKNTGIVSRKKLVKIFNPANGHFVVLWAMGANEGRPLPRDAMAIDYDAKLALGISKKEEEAELIVGEANLGDREFFHMYTDHDASSRSARALGWYLFMAGIGWSVGVTVEGLVTAMLRMF